MDREKLSQQLDDLWDRVNQGRSACSSSDLQRLTHTFAEIESELVEEQFRLLREGLSQQNERWSRLQEEGAREIAHFRERLRLAEARLEQRAGEAAREEEDDAQALAPPPAAAPGAPQDVETFVRLLSGLRQSLMCQRLLWKRRLADIHRALHARPGEIPEQAYERLAQALEPSRGSLASLRQSTDHLVGRIGGAGPGRVPGRIAVRQHLEGLASDTLLLSKAVETMLEQIPALPSQNEGAALVLASWLQLTDGAWDKWWRTVDRVETDLVSLKAALDDPGPGEARPAAARARGTEWTGGDARPGDLEARLRQRDADLAEAHRRAAALEERERSMIRRVEELKFEFDKLRSERFGYARDSDPLYKEWQSEKRRLLQEAEERQLELSRVQEEWRGQSAGFQERALLETRWREAASALAEIQRKQADERLRFEQGLAAERQRTAEAAEQGRRRFEAGEAHHRRELQALQEQWTAEWERLQAELRGLRQAREADALERLRQDGRLAALEAQRAQAQASLEEILRARDLERDLWRQAIASKERPPRSSAPPEPLEQSRQDQTPLLEDRRRLQAELAAALRRVEALEWAKDEFRAALQKTSEGEKTRQMAQAKLESDLASARAVIEALKAEKAQAPLALQAAREDWQAERQRLIERAADEEARRAAELQRLENAFAARESAWRKEQEVFWAEVRKARESPPIQAPAAPAPKAEKALIEQNEALSSRIKDLEQRLLNYQDQVSSLQAGVKEADEREANLQARLDEVLKTEIGKDPVRRDLETRWAESEDRLRQVLHEQDAWKKRAAVAERTLEKALRVPGAEPLRRDWESDLATILVPPPPVPKSKARGGGRRPAARWLFVIAALSAGAFVLPWGANRLWEAARQRHEVQRKALAEAYYKSGFDAMSLDKMETAVSELSKALAEDAEHQGAKKLLVLSLWDLADQQAERRDWAAARETLNSLSRRLPGDAVVAERLRAVDAAQWSGDAP